MGDDSPPLVPSPERLSLSNNKKSSSWNFDDLHAEDESDNSNDFFSAIKHNVAKNVYYDEEAHNDDYVCNKITERSTVRVDGSDLISRCKNFLPLLTDANHTLFSKMKSGENVRIELDSDEDDENDGRAIEMNLMFCPNVDISSDSEELSDESDNDQTTIKTLQCSKNKSQVSIMEIQSANNIQDENKSDNTINT